MAEQTFEPPQFEDTLQPAKPLVRTPARSESKTKPTSATGERKRSFISTIDKPLILIVGLLLSIGGMMIYSTTFDWSLATRGSNSAIFVGEHLRNLGISLLAMLFFMVIDYRFWKRFAVPLLLITIGSLIAVLLFGDDTFGARRALIAGRFQPGELAEFTTIFYMAAWLGARRTRIRSFAYGLIPFFTLVGILGGLVALQPDLSSSAIIFMTALVMFFLAGASVRQLVLTIFGIAIVSFVAVQNVSYAGDRWDSYRRGLTDLTEANYHTQQAISAFLNGGWFGVGLGQSEQKIAGLPAAHTDSIFAVIGEELGVIGAAVVVLLFVTFAVRGIQIAWRATDSFGMLLVTGTTIWVVIKALLNIAVMTALVPSTGVPLPFISFGGSSLLVLMGGVGLMFSVHRVTYLDNLHQIGEIAVQIMIAAGGTGGHVYPALAVAEALLKFANPPQLSFVGTIGGFEEQLIHESGIPFAETHAIFAGPIHGVPILQLLLSVIKMVLGVIQSFLILLRQRPQALLLTGGWANIPLALVGWMLRIPILVYLPDIEPGLTIRVLKYLATKVAVTVDELVQYFREGQAVITGYPLRESVMQASRDDAITHFGLDPTRKTLLVTGGSRGARSINIAVQEIAQRLLDLGIQIIHITGTTDWDDAQERASHLENQERYHLYPYLHDDMGLAYAVADIAICRAGASTLGELPYFELPSILVPYPYAWRYQKTNADYLANRSVAIQMNDEDMSKDLYPTLQRLISDETEYQAMKTRAKLLAQKNGSANIAQLLLEMAGGSPV